MFCLRVMVGVIILYDHVHPIGAFNKASTIDVSQFYLFVLAQLHICNLVWMLPSMDSWKIKPLEYSDILTTFSRRIARGRCGRFQSLRPDGAATRRHLISHHETEKLPFVTCSTKNRDSQLSVSIFVTCLNQVYDIHAFIAKEILVSLSNEHKKAAQLFETTTLTFFPPQWYLPASCVFIWHCCFVYL